MELNKSMPEDKQFYVGQKAIIEKDGEVLVLFESTEANLDYPGGKIQEGELDFAEALKREVREEANLEIEVGAPFATWYYEIKKGRSMGKKIFLVAYKCKYLSGEVNLSEEHVNYRWVNKDNFHELDTGGDYFGVLKKYFSK